MLQISRSDVVSDRILEYPVSTRFIKLPVERYLEKINVDPVPAQIALINAINNPKYRFITAALSRRQGKTYIANIIGHLVSLIPGCNILIMSPNYSLSQISFELQRSLIKKFDLEVARDNVKDKVIELSNSSTVRMGSVNNVDSCVGRSYDLIIFDEAALSDGRDAFNVALRPTLDRPNSKCIFISTPRGRSNWFAEFYYRGYSDQFPEWCSIRATWEANPRVSIADIEEARRSMSEAEFRQEYEADFNTFEGQIWKLNYDKCVRTFSHEGLEIFAGLDVGFKDATAMCVVGYSFKEGLFYILDEYKAVGKTTAGHAAAIQELIKKWGIERIYIDSAAAQTRFDLAQTYGIATTKAKKAVLEGIGHVSSLVEHDRIIVDPNAKEVLKTFDNYKWDMTPGRIKESPVHDDSSHMADALRYALYSFNTSEAYF